MTVTFSPTAATSYGGTVTVNADQTSGVTTIAASGTGTQVATRVVALSGNLAFGNVTVGTTAQTTLTIANTGNSTLTVSSISYPAGFSGNWAGGTIAAASSQPVTVTFSPTAASSYGGTVTVNADQTSGVNAMQASGTGTVDITPPVIAITSATNGQSFTSPSISVSGDSWDNVGVVLVSWSLDQGGGGGTAVGTTNWVIRNLTLRSGTNVLTIIAFDAAGNSSSTNVSLVCQSSRFAIGPSSIVGQTFSFTVQTTVGLNYTLEYKTSLADPVWSAGETASGTGGTVTLNDATAATPARFYRVHVH